MSAQIAELEAERGQLSQKIRALGDWFHNIEIGGVPTAPDHFLGDYPRVKWKRFQNAIPADLRGKTVLDIGCNGGFYSIEMKRRGADRVLGVDFDDRYLAQARFAHQPEVDLDPRSRRGRGILRRSGPIFMGSGCRAAAGRLVMEKRAGCSLNPLNCQFHDLRVSSCMAP